MLNSSLNAVDSQTKQLSGEWLPFLNQSVQANEISVCKFLEMAAHTHAHTDTQTHTNKDRNKNFLSFLE